MKYLNEIKEWSKEIGPSAMVAATLIGPGTIAASLIAGSGFGYSLLWLVIPAGIWLAALNYMTGSVTIATGQTTLENLDTYIFKGWGKINGWIQLVCTVLAGAFVSVSMSSILQVFFPSLSYMTLTLIMLVITLYFIVYLGKFGLIRSILSTFIVTLTVLFLINLLFIPLPFESIVGGLIPSIPEGSENAIFAIIGGSVAGLPLLFYPYQVKQAGWTKEKLHVMKWDNIMIVAIPFSLISVSVLLAAAALKVDAPIGDAMTAAESLQPVAGSVAKWIFIVGFFGAVYTTAVTPSFAAGYYLSDMLNWRAKEDGTKKLIDTDIHADSRFKWITAIALTTWLIGPSLLNYIDPFEIITIGLGIINLFAPFVMLSIFYIATNKKIMGELQIGWFVRIVVSISFIFSCIGVWTFVKYLINNLL